MLKLTVLEGSFSICKVVDYSLVNFNALFLFIGKTDQEFSLVCLRNDVPDNCTHCINGYKAFRINGELDFSLIGILASITEILAENKIGIFAISTYNTDYVLVKKEQLTKAIQALIKAGYGVIQPPIK